MRKRTQESNGRGTEQGVVNSTHHLQTPNEVPYLLLDVVSVVFFVSDILGGTNSVLCQN
jgi:hypothetical protein